MRTRHTCMQNELDKHTNTSAYASTKSDTKQKEPKKRVNDHPDHLAHLTTRPILLKVECQTSQTDPLPACLFRGLAPLDAESTDLITDWDLLLLCHKDRPHHETRQRIEQPTWRRLEPCTVARRSEGSVGLDEHLLKAITAAISAKSGSIYWLDQTFRGGHERRRLAIPSTRVMRACGIHGTTPDMASPPGPAKHSHKDHYRHYNS